MHDMTDLDLRTMQEPCSIGNIPNVFYQQLVAYSAEWDHSCVFMQPLWPRSEPGGVTERSRIGACNCALLQSNLKGF